MLALVQPIVFHGVDIIRIDVGHILQMGLPTITFTTSFAKVVSGSCDSARVVVLLFVLALPLKRIAIIIAPEDVSRDGVHFDLPTALGLFTAIGAVPRLF